MLIQTTKSDFHSILPLWEEHLWPQRKSPILATSALQLGGGIDLSLVQQVPVFFAATDGNKLIGAISGFQTGPNAFRVRGITVLPEYRKQGVGSQLMNTLIHHAQQHGFGMLWTAPRSDNLGFYERHGFKKFGEWTTENFEEGPHCYAIRYVAQPKNSTDVDLNKPYFESVAKKTIFDSDAFSSGQILSKLWLCEELERIVKNHSLPHATLWHLCGWNGVLPFLLLTRNNLNLKKIRSFDIDENAVAAADQLLNTWEWQEWAFKAIKYDIHKLDYSQPHLYHSEKPDIVVNCAIEHLKSDEWWHKIPDEMVVVLQGTDMKAEDHHQFIGSVEDLLQLYPPKTVYFSGTKHFTYASGFKFSRFMFIGRK